VPETRYAKSGDVDIAYQTVGDGPTDLIWVAGFVTHLDVLWEDPSYRRFCERLGTFSRLVLFDKRGMGLSEHVRAATLEERMDDVRAVMDAIGIQQAALIGISEGGPMSVLFAATYPERTRALILCGGEVKEERTDDWPWGEATWDEWNGWMADIDTTWGQGDMWWHIAPSAEGDVQARDWWNRMMRNAINPSAAVEFMRMGMGIDIRHVLPAVNVPTLILHRTDDQVCHVENARYMAKHIPGARYVELPGNDHAAWVKADDVLAEIQEFLTGVREPAAPDRVLATVLFTDIVGSTAIAAEMGDRRWAELLERHHAVVRGELARFRGHEVDTAGDGFFATFDGPARAIRCARAIASSVRQLGIQVRSGVHAGECELLDGKVGGVAVHTGARVASLADPNEVLVSSTVRDLVAGSGLTFEDAGEHELKGVPDSWHLYRVIGTG
jgi:class 3 adenylate cyclase